MLDQDYVDLRDDGGPSESGFENPFRKEDWIQTSRSKVSTASNPFLNFQKDQAFNRGKKVSPDT
jgi:hypothetical protein